jgi:PAS domain S-box-containing protein
MKEKIKDAGKTHQQTEQAETPGTSVREAYEELQRRTEDLALINLLNDTINQGGSLQEAIKLLSKETRRLFSSYGATVYLLSEDEEYLVAQNLGLPPRLVNTIEKLIGIKIPPLRVRLKGPSLYSEKLKNRRPLLINDSETIKRYMYEFTDDKRVQKFIPAVHKILGIHSMMGIPLISDGQVFGLMEISRDKPFTESDLQRLATIAGQITNTIKRKQAEEALKKSEEKFAKAFHSSPNASSISTLKEGRCIDMNESFSIFTGYESDEVIGSIVTDKNLWVEPADRTRLVRMLQEKGGVRDLEVKLRAKSGDIKLGLLSAVLTDIGGEPCILATGRDVTQQKRAQEALQESEEKLRQMFRSMSEGLVVTDLDGVIVDVNDRLLEMHGFGSRDEVIGKHGTELSALFERDRVIENEQTMLEGGSVKSTEFTLLRTDGSTFPVELSMSLLRDASDKPIGFITVGRDITNRKRAEGKHQSIIQTALDGFWINDLEGRFLEVNDSYCKMTGYSRDELLKMSITDIESLETPEETGRRIKNIAEQGSSYFETRHRRKDGEIIDVEISVNYLDVSNGQMCVFIRDITERKRAEAALQESEEKLRQMFRSVSDGLTVADLDGVIVDVNDRFLEMHGFGSRDEVIGKHALELPAPFERGSIAANAQKMLEEGFVKSTEFTLLRTDGSTFPVELSMSLLRDASDKPIGFITVGRDITERKRAEGKHQLIIQTALDGFWISDLEGRFLEVNDSYCKMTGYSREELLKMSMEDIEASESPEEMAQRLKLIKQKGYDLFETKLRRKDGKTIDVEISINYLDVDNGQMYVFIRDITERKRAEALFRTLANSSPLGIYIVQDGKFQFTNPQFQRQVSHSEEELMGTDALSFVAAEDRERVRENAVRMLKGEISLPYEYRSLDGHGETRWVLETVAPIEYHGKRATVGTHMDITERKMLQQEQQRLGKLESIGTLAGGIAHDFNNILTGIMGNISLALRNVEPDGKVAERLLEAEKASLRAKDLTHRLLTFARGGAPIKKTIATADLIRESADLALRGSNTRCDCSLPDELWSLEADEGQINQVFTNLIINASEAMPEGGTLHIAARNMVNKRKGPLPLPRGNYVEITIKDQGTGIAKGHLERIFEPYFTTKQKGSGLGLATVYSIIKNHDGHIEVSSELGTGTTFTIYLPASSKPAPVKKKVVAEAPVPGKERILVMDDEPAIRQLLKRMLTGVGYEIELSQDGKEAIEKYTQAREAGQPFEAIIMDLTIPGGMGGKEAISTLLEIDPGVKAIVSSGYSTDPIMADYNKYGFSGVVAKPYVAADLEKALRNVIQGINV